MFEDEEIIEKVVSFVMVRTKPIFRDEMTGILGQLVSETMATRNIAMLVELPTIPTEMIQPEFVGEVDTIKQYFSRHPLVVG